jgi:hypothetical protein
LKINEYLVVEAISGKPSKATLGHELAFGKRILKVFAIDLTPFTVFAIPI